MEYKVLKDFGSAIAGDIFRNDEFVPEMFNMYNKTTDSGYECIRSMSLTKDIVDSYVDQGLLEEVKENRGSKTIEYIDSLLEQYNSDYKETMAKYNNGELPSCVKVEAETVYYNLTKVLNKIKEVLKDEQIG